MPTHGQLILLIGKVISSSREPNFTDHIAIIPSRLRIRIVPEGRIAVLALPSHGQITY